MEFNGHRWYHRLVENSESRIPSLMKNYNLKQLSRMVSVCFTPNFNPFSQIKVPYLTEDGSHVRLYSSFRTYTYLFGFINLYSLEDRTFYELIFGEIDQKLHFDVDISDELLPSAENIKDELIKSIYNVLREVCDVELDVEEDVLIFTSHSNSKKSYHVIIDNYKVKNNIECKYFYTLCLQGIQENYRKAIDHAVYGSRQNFRLLGCTKSGVYRPKIFNKEFELFGKKVKNSTNTDTGNSLLDFYNVFTKSLVSMTSTCKFLNGLSKALIPRVFNDVEIPEKTVENILLTMKEKIEDSPFIIANVGNGIISLKSTRKYFCQLCDRFHDHENPYINILNGRAFWNCRRSETGSIFLGDVEIIEIEEEEGEGEVFINILNKKKLNDFFLKPSCKVLKVKRKEVIFSMTTTESFAKEKPQTLDILQKNTKLGSLMKNLMK